MKHPQNALRALFAGLMVFCLSFSLLISPNAANAQSVPNPAPANETILTGSYVIPMDNNYQGRSLDNDCSDTAFNLKAYGLAVRLLHNNIPIKWVISATKTNKDNTDFSANVVRIQGRSDNHNSWNNPCSAEGGNYNFAGGPLVIPVEYTSLAAPIIEAFNDEIDNSSENSGRVRVYRTTANTSAPVRYTLTHKPLVAVGPDGGGFGNGVYQKLYAYAKITSAPGVNAYANVTNENIKPDSCYTIAAQAHAADNAVNYISQYRLFAQSGGNLLLQCYSIDVFENNFVSGLFQTTAGWRIYTTNNPPDDDVTTPLFYPSPGMPFNQFVGDISDATGKVSEYRLNNNSNFKPGTLISARNTTRNGNNYSDRNVATVSRIGSSLAGGHVFELGGHEYDGTSGSLGEKNGARMELNALLVPATRAGCGLDIPQVLGYKHVQLTNDVNSNGFINPGDTVTWTINYVNTSDVPSSNFQIVDALQTGLTITSTGSQTVNTTGTGTSASKNTSYNGNGNNNLLAPGAILGAGGRITVTIQTTINAGTYGTLLNHPLANGSGISSGGVTTDTIDGTTQGTQGDVSAPSGSYPQDTWQTAGLDPTGIQILSPSAADSTVSGTVIDWTGTGLSRTAVTLTDIGTGISRTVMTNSFGVFRFTDVETGHFHIITAVNPRYQFRVSSFSFTVNEDVVGLTFVAGPGPAQRGAESTTSAR